MHEDENYIKPQGKKPPLPAMLQAGFASHPKPLLHPEHTLYRFLSWHDFHPSLRTAPTCLVV